MLRLLKKMTIEAFKDQEARNSGSTPIDSYEVMFNPSTYTLGYAADYNYVQAAGSSGAELTFQKIPPQTYSFEFLIDGTGTSGSDVEFIPATRKEVSSEVASFFKVCGEIDGEIHRPYYLKLRWGKLILDCSLTNSDVEYTLFKPNGDPLRATIKASFVSTVDSAKKVLLDRFSSPDLTHVRIVKVGDTLPGMSKAIYGDASLYREVAKANGLTNFRSLKPGQEIFFPPIEKSA